MPPRVVVLPADSIAAMGDSITQAADSCKPWDNCPEYSWSTGSVEDVYSHAQRLQDQQTNDTTIKVYNNSKSFMTVEDLPRQATLTTSQSPEYITILIGSNDVCTETVEQMTSEADFENSFQEAINILSNKLPETKIFVVSIPNIKNLWAVGRTHPEILKQWAAGSTCQSMLANPTSNHTIDQIRRDKVEKRIIAFNSIIEKVCAETENCAFDNNALFNHEFTLDELSTVDYFHPSVHGQNMIARLTWESLPNGFTLIKHEEGSISNPDAPRVKIQLPENNGVVSGNKYTLVAIVKAPNKIEEVYLDTAIGKFPLWKRGDTWVVEIDTTLAPNGTTTTFKVVAVDVKGNAGISKDTTVTVKNSN